MAIAASVLCLHEVDECVVDARQVAVAFGLQPFEDLCVKPYTYSQQLAGMVRFRDARPRRRRQTASLVCMPRRDKAQPQSAVSLRGRIAANGLAIALGIALLAAIVAGVVVMRSTGDRKVTIGSNDEVYYYRRATREDALALGRMLQRIGFLNDRGTSVLLWKGSSATVVSFVLDGGAWDHPNAMSNFAEIGRRIANTVGGFPLQVRLVDAGRIIRRELTVGRVTIGARDIVYYFGSATQADATALGHALETAGYFTGSGFTVELLKGEGTVVSFLVQEGAWEQPAAVATLERLVGQVAPSIGGLPIQLRLVDRDMETRKAVTIQ